MLAAVVCLVQISTLAVAQEAPPSSATEPNATLTPPTAFQTQAGGRGIRAVRIAEPIRLDGRLDDPVYAAIPPIGDFIQQEPREGEPATEATDIWILFDDTNIYVSARCWDSHPERAVANEMRRDAQNIVQNESIGVMFDTFHDKRNSIYFQIGLAGGMRDGLGTDESNSNINWNTVWDARTARDERGWTAEMVIPFKSLRYNPGPDQVWGINVRRIVRWKNETSYLTPVPAFLALRGLLASSLAATMVDLEVPPSGRNVEAKPYVIGSVSTDRVADPAGSYTRHGEFGADVKYGLTKGMTLDLTYNTDFAQVEDDLQQVNLTRFNLFFPERRDFFLEGQGIFMFGGISSIGGEGGASNNTPVMFFSRRIGLNNNRSVPIVGGARVTGRAGAYSIGALNLQAGEDNAANARATNFTVFRVKRDIAGRSHIGVIYTRRAETAGDISAEPGDTIGVDALYSASRSLNVNAYLARTRKPGIRGNDGSALLRLDYNTDRYGVQLEHLSVGANFNPEVGFLRRSDFRRQFALARFSPRPARTHMTRVRQFSYQSTIEYIEDGAGVRIWRELNGQAAIDFQNGDSLSARYTDDDELVPRPFPIARDITVSAGGYGYRWSQVSYQLGAQHKVAGTAFYQHGTLYGGSKRTLGWSNGRVELSPRLAIEPSVSINWVHLPAGRFTTAVVGARHTFMVSPRLIASALIQYNKSAQTVNTNARLRWEYRPGSELFVVYTDGRDASQRGFPDPLNRALVVKVNRLFRF